jgi:hypothetical protein
MDTELLGNKGEKQSKSKVVDNVKNFLILGLLAAVIALGIVNTNLQKKLNSASTASVTTASNGTTSGAGNNGTTSGNNGTTGVMVYDSQPDPNFFHVSRIYVDANNVSHWGDIIINMTNNGLIGSLSQEYNLTTMDFRYTPGTYNFPPHPSPRRQFVVNLKNGVNITTGDGVTRLLGAGEVFLLEDTFGTGHTSVAIDGLARSSLFIGIADNTTFPL